VLTSFLAIDLLDKTLNAVRQARYRWADGEHAPAPIVVSVRLLEDARHQTITVIALKIS
jgi:hypothetical protein